MKDMQPSSTTSRGEKHSILATVTKTPFCDKNNYFLNCRLSIKHKFPQAERAEEVQDGFSLLVDRQGGTALLEDGGGGNLS